MDQEITSVYTSYTSVGLESENICSTKYTSNAIMKVNVI